MSILSKIYKKIKGSNTDAEFVFTLAVATLNSKQKAQLRSNLGNVQKAIIIALAVDPSSTAVKEAKLWVDGALEILN